MNGFYQDTDNNGWTVMDFSYYKTNIKKKTREKTEMKLFNKIYFISNSFQYVCILNKSIMLDRMMIEIYDD